MTSRFPMRIRSLASLALAVCLLLPSLGLAQPRGPVSIDKMVVGFPTDAARYQFKSGAWTPVFVDLTAGPSGLPKADMVVETDDSDDVRSRYTVLVPSLDPKEQTTVVGYIRPGSTSPEITVTVRVDGKPVATFKEIHGAIGLEEQILLSIGSRLSTLRAALNPVANQAAEGEVDLFKDEGPRRAAMLDDIRMLPKQWYAYEPVDVMILATGNRDFITALINDREGRKEAIAEWVRRGGKLIISLGRNQDMLANLEPIQSMLPVRSTGSLQFPQLFVVEKWVGPPQRPFENLKPRGNASAPRPPVEIAKLEKNKDREIDVVLPPQHQEGPLILLQGAYGMGRVTVLAFDLDAVPFTTWVPSAQRDFWIKLIELTAPPLSPTAQNQRQFGIGGMEIGQQDLATNLESNLEDFEDVPVISFGWVALFILVYILVVGPLDYFFLKKVVKRLELTWITFPTVVITISVVAYFTAYWLKGNDQKINKVDLVDVDVATQQLYGNTWFTIFSPRIQHYTVGLEPAWPEWVIPPVAGKQDSSVTMSWMVRPETGFGGSGRARSQGLFRRAYDYAEDAMAMTGVPIQVWSTKSFSASWQAAMDTSKPLIEADLRHPKGKAELVIGTITSHLPADLQDVYLYYSGGGNAKWYQIGRLVPENSQRVDNVLTDNANAKDMKTWITTVAPDAMRRGTNPQGMRPGMQGQGSDATMMVLKRLMFHQLDGTQYRDGPLRYLDQSWRVHHKDEVMLVGRFPRQDGQAEAVARNPASPSRLWLGAVPKVGEPRPDLLGTMTQETYVRIIVPVRSGELN